MPDDADDAGATGLRVDRDGRLWVATRMGLQVCDQAGRVNCIIPPPAGRVTRLCFAGSGFMKTFGDRVSVYGRYFATGDKENPVSTVQFGAAKSY